MTKGWRVIDCTAMTGKLTYKRGQLVVEHHDTETRIPLADTAVLLLGIQTTVSTALLQQLAVFDVEVLICQWNEIPIAALQPWNKPNTRSAARQTAQQEMSIPTRKAAWKRIIQAKILGQSHVLDMLELDGGQLLRSLAAQVRSGDPNNIEGQAAREYWHRMFPEEQFRRFPGYGEGRNAQLDYAYTILRGFLIKSICTAGLSPHHRHTPSFRKQLFLSGRRPDRTVPTGHRLPDKPTAGRTVGFGTETADSAGRQQPIQSKRTDHPIIGGRILRTIRAILRRLAGQTNRPNFREKR